MFILFLRELAMSLILAGTGNPVATVVMFDYYQSGELPPMAGASVLMITIMILMVWVAQKLFKISYTDIRIG